MNGWKNYETWNVALWISSDPDLYELAKGSHTWAMLRRRLMWCGYDSTGDGVWYMSRKISGREITGMIKEIRAS